MRGNLPHAGKIRKYTGPNTFTDYQQCARCGIATVAEFCRDCKAVDPEFTAGGKTRRQLEADRKAQREKWRDLTDTLARVAGQPSAMSSRRRRRVA